ncbi:MAG TPA: hypothetical protein VFV97_13020, partial [Rhodanobacteraceae bacterium]|nr:hypothetical protein [Rhodanobacteraceae bacterium]
MCVTAACVARLLRSRDTGVSLSGYGRDSRTDLGRPPRARLASRRCGSFSRINPMARFDRTGMLALRQEALPACIAALFSVTAFATSAGRGPADLPAQPENVRIVTNCDDAGGGSLRDAVTNAVSGDVIDLSGLACGKITLTNGKLSATMGDLMLLGSGVGPDATHPLTIYGYYDQIIDHGTGTLVISGLRLIGGSAYGKGGCVSSQGSLVIESSIISGCGAYSPAGANVVAAGGAVFAAQDLWIHKSAITDSFAYAGTEVSYGGGVFASGIVTIEDSTIAGNKAIAPTAYAVGGGVAVVGVDDVLIMSSTISGNEATFGGGLHIDTLGTTEVVDGTLSGNYAAAYGGAGSF